MILVCFMNAKFVKVAAAKSHELRIQHTSPRPSGDDHHSECDLFGAIAVHHQYGHRHAS
jgi:hypothetical protein